MASFTKTDMSVLRTLWIHQMAMTIAGISASLRNRHNTVYADRNIYRALDILETSQLVTSRWNTSGQDKGVTRWALTGPGLKYVTEWSAKHNQLGK